MRMLVVFAMMLSFTPISLGAGSKKPLHTKVKGDVDVAFITEMVGGKKTWVMVPSQATFKKGRLVKAKVINLLDAPHGFEIPGIKKPMVVKAHSSLMVEYKAAKAGSYAVKCHLHPAHVATKFSVK